MGRSGSDGCGARASGQAGVLWELAPNRCSSRSYFFQPSSLHLSHDSPRKHFLSWGWRIPFLISLLLVVVGLIIRVRIIETPAFSKMKEQRQEAKQPIFEVLRHYPREVLVAMGARLAENGAFYIYTVFILIYGTQHVGMDRNIVLTGIMVAAALELAAIPLFGWLSDLVGRRPVYLFGAIMTAVLAYPLFWMMDSASPGLSRWHWSLPFRSGTPQCMRRRARSFRSCLVRGFDTAVPRLGHNSHRSLPEDCPRLLRLLS